MDLSRLPAQARISTNLAAMPLELDENGTFAAKTVMIQGKGMVAVPPREAFVDAVTLVEMIRQVVKQEIKELVQELRNGS